MVLVRYTLMRILLFVGFFLLFAMLPIDLLWAAVAAVLASMIASYFILRPDRDRLAAGLEHRVEERMARRREQMEAERVAEDEEAERLTGESDRGHLDR